MKLLQRRILLAMALTLVVAPLMVVNACGPYFFPDVFTPPHHPKITSRYLKGELGIVQPRYSYPEKVVAFRYLNGGTLNADERYQWTNVVPDPTNWERMSPQQYKQKQQEEEAAMQNMPDRRWLRERSLYANAPSVPERRNRWDVGPQKPAWGEAANCTDSAYENAIHILQVRVNLWGAKSPVFLDWLKAQDAVFGNCNLDAPAPLAAPLDAPLLLKQDRAYQMAATLLYKDSLDEAASAFSAIAQDTASPWAKWGDYLAARCLIRKAGKTAPASNSDVANFDRPLLEQAKARLLLVLAQSKDAEVRHAAQSKLDFIAIRLDPQKRTQELALFLAGPKHDADFGQHLADLHFLLSNKLRGDAPLVRWLELTDTRYFNFDESYDEEPRPLDTKLAEKSLQAWKLHPQLPWLIAALQNSKDANPELLEAAEKVPEASPGYFMAQYHRARLLMESDPSLARTIATSLLASAARSKDDASINAVLAIRMQTATSLEEVLADAPRRMMHETESQAGIDAGCSYASRNVGGCRIEDLQFDEDAANLFNEQMPLVDWIKAAQNDKLPPHLRLAMARAGWVRAAILQDRSAMSALRLLMDTQLQKSASAEDADFAAALTVLRYPGLSPFLNQGVQRSLSFHRMDSYRWNLWCTNRAYKEQPERKAPLLVRASYLSEEERAQAKREVALIANQPNGVLWAGERVIHSVRANPGISNGAEALAQLVRETRYTCGDFKNEGRISAISKEAFTLLHKNYPNSEWAARTKYYY